MTLATQPGTTLIKGGLVVDGTGVDGRLADVLIAGGIV